MKINEKSTFRVWQYGTGRFIIFEQKLLEVYHVISKVTYIRFMLGSLKGSSNFHGMSVHTQTCIYIDWLIFNFFFNLIFPDESYIQFFWKKIIFFFKGTMYISSKKRIFHRLFFSFFFSVKYADMVKDNVDLWNPCSCLKSINLQTS